MEEKTLISKLQELNQIKPRKEWAILTKSQILSENNSVVKIPVQKIGIQEIISSIISASLAKKMAYAFAAFLFVIIGLAGFALDTSVLQEKFVASLSGEKSPEQSLTKQIKENVKILAQTINKDPRQNSETLKQITVSLKTLASLAESDLVESREVIDLYQALAKNQIENLEKTTLTEEQAEKLEKAKELYEQKKYSEALEGILLINN